jgi:hypothetical protein
MGFTRREFLRTSLRAGLALPALRALPAWAAGAADAGLPDPSRGLRGDSSLGALLRAGGELPPVAPLARRAFDTGVPLALRYPDLSRHFVFEYYPWYANDPFRHWQQDGRHPPFDVASNYMPFLGAYDSRAAAVIEEHARWIAESGAGAVNLSWWGEGSFEDRTTPLVMDVMAAHGIKVTFHLEPYVRDHGQRFARDVLHLLREFGEKRRFDALLLLRDEGGATGPVFKGFRTLLPVQVRDCRGVTRPVRDYTPDDTYRRQFESLRGVLRGDFDHVTLLADTTDGVRAGRAGFDGVAIYDNFVGPDRYAAIAERASREGIVFSLNTNPGNDIIEPRDEGGADDGAPSPPTPPSPTEPDRRELDFSLPGDRERAAVRSKRRISTSLETSLALQTDPALSNDKRGFLLVYVNSFNEWHEGHQFEPMRNAADIRPEEQPFGYHNPQQGDYRLQHLAGLLQGVLRPPAESAGSRRASTAFSLPAQG